MNSWQQTKTFECRRCPAVYLHDHAFAHNQYQCAQREGAARITPDPVPRMAEIKSVNPAMDQTFSNRFGCGVGSFRDEAPDSQ